LLCGFIVVVVHELTIYKQNSKWSMTRLWACPKHLSVQTKHLVAFIVMSLCEIPKSWCILTIDFLRPEASHVP
jgi:hypothetical protein